MKRILSILFAAIAFIASAQNEISISYGAFPVGSKNMPHVIHDYGTWPSSSTPPVKVIRPVDFENVKNWGSINVMYLRSFTDRISAGASYSYSSFKAHEMTPNIGFGLPTTHTHSVMLTGKWTWVSKAKFSIYSRVGAGVRFSKASFPSGTEMIVNGSEYWTDDLCQTYLMKGSKADFAWQVSALCADFKICDHFGIFAEAGAGFQGCIQAGVKTTF